MTSEVLVRKLHPNNFSNMSPQMAAIVGHLVGEVWTHPGHFASLSITSDNFALGLTEDDHGNYRSVFIGFAEDVYENLTRLAAAAELTSEEGAAFQRLIKSRIADFRPARAGERPPSFVVTE